MRVYLHCILEKADLNAFIGLWSVMKKGSRQKF